MFKKSPGRVGSRLVLKKDPDRWTHFIIVLPFFDTPDEQAQEGACNDNTD
jgi:hypothetical protein